jgi:ketosteroid isomerase-like protein
MNDMGLEEELLQFSQAWDEAMVENDAIKIGSFMSDDWVIVGTEGGVTGKANFLRWIESDDLTHNRMDADDVRVKIYGNTGLLTSRGTSAGHYKGEPFNLYEWSSNVFVKSNGQWLCVLTMLTPAIENQKGNNVESSA